ncbi:hypothetical protein B0H13DRAFT_2120481 [Mycena leptocephala]|nr:hypothetical protein B0H13DRAFT_2120481 [Mycena leptocephala]
MREGKEDSRRRAHLAQGNSLSSSSSSPASSIPFPFASPFPITPALPNRRTSKLKTPDSAQAGPIAAARANAVVGQATPSTSTAALASPAGTSRPVRSWAGVARAWGHLAGTKGGGSAPVCSPGAGIDSGGDDILADLDLGRRRRVFGAVAATGRMALGAGRSIHPRRDEMKKT